MTKPRILLVACCFVAVIAAAQQIESSFNWPADYSEHVKKLATDNEKISSLTNAVSDLHNQSMRDQANSQWLQTQIDLIVKYVDENRPTVSKLNGKIEELEHENEQMKSRMKKFQTTACPMLLRTAASSEEKRGVNALCR